MIIKELKKDSELKEFLENTSRLINIEFPIKYLKENSKVIGIYKKESLVAGFVLVTRPPFRVIQSLPDSLIESDQFLLNNINNMMEVTGLWMLPEEKNVKLRNILWYSLMKYILTSQRKYFTYAYSLNKPKLAKLYKIASPRVIFQGRTKQLPGMPYPEEESIELVKISKRNLFLKAVPKFLVYQGIKFSQNKLKQIARQF